jgi:uncharacterized protein (DUF1501 family)
MNSTRREFLRLGLGTSTLLACAASVPSFLARSARVLAAEPSQSKERILVVVQLSGGNDGLNTVVPYSDPAYVMHRPHLQLPLKILHRIDDHIGLHQSLAGFRKLLDSRQLAIVQSVGYPNPNRSHFESMTIWQTARLDPLADTPGWLARSLDLRPAKPGGDAPAMHIGDRALPQALYGGQQQVPSLASPEQFRRRLGIADGQEATALRTALDQVSSSGRSKPGSLLDFVERSTLITYASSARLESILKNPQAGSDYPQFGLGQRLALIAQLIKSGLTSSIYYTELEGFDTHANQRGTHDLLLREVDTALKAFVDDMHKSSDGQRVLVLVFSEFGRRLQENGSNGTDHGTAAPVFVLGDAVRSGVHGPYPNLQDLQDGDPRHAIDFRRVYASVLDQWLQCPSQTVLGQKFEPLPLVTA